jgi:hypothetical protein
MNTGILEIAIALIAIVVIVAMVVRGSRRVGLQFSIRDLLWLTLVVALAIGWAVSYRHYQSQYLEASRETQLEQRNNRTLQEENDTLRKRIHRLWSLSEEVSDSQESGQHK